MMVKAAERNTDKGNKTEESVSFQSGINCVQVQTSVDELH